MKMIVAIIRLDRLEAVRDALSAIGVQGITATEVKGFGRQKGHTEMYRGSEVPIDFVTKVKLEIGVHTTPVQSVIDSICEEAKSSAVGDGKIFVYDIEHVVRIRTGETDADAL